MTRTLGILAFAGLLTLAVRPTTAAEKPVKIGTEIANLTFKDIRYLPRSLNDFGEKKAYVIVFTTTKCPLALRYLPTLNKLEKEYRDKGVQFLAMNVGLEDSILDMGTQAVQHGCEFPFVKDFDHDSVKALGVKKTPEVVVLDAKRTLSYRGRIDDQYRHGGVRHAPTRHDLREALDAVLGGKEIAVKHTTVDGCVITCVETRKVEGAVTFAEHIAPLMQKHCQECHRPGTTAPFSLLNYKQVAGKADTIADVIRDERMPPWFASPEHGKFMNKRVLTSSEKDQFHHWVATGKPMGDESKMPKPLPIIQQTSKWLIGEPDLIIQAAEQELPASGDIPYKYIILPHIFLNDTWVQGIQILPDNPRALHHCNMAFVEFGKKFDMNNFITGTVPGGSPMQMQTPLGYRLPRGSSLVLQIHYVTTGKPEKCRLSVGLKFASGRVDKQIKFTLLEDKKFAIPPGAPAHETRASHTLTHDALGIGMFVHMHLRGKDMTFLAHYPDGKSETLLVVPNYNFDWQIPYVWEPGSKRFPKGTRLEAVAHYDNSAFNPFNPDPKDTVKNGPYTYHEMMNGFVFYLDEAEKLGLEIDGKTGRVKGK